MGADLVPRLRKMQRLGLHYTAGGAEMVATLLLFCGASGSALEAMEHNYGYVRKKDALRLAEKLELLRARLKAADARQVLEHRALLSREELETLVLSISRDIGLPDPPGWLLTRTVEMLIDTDWDHGYDIPRLIRLCRHGGGFWWS
jgi:hypothetical protein